MVRELADQVIKQVTQTYPYLAYPMAVRARITSKAETSREKTQDCLIRDVGTGEIRPCQIVQPYYRYAVQVVEAGSQQTRYPILPDIESTEVCSIGDTVTVVFTGTDMYPVIIGG